MSSGPGWRLPGHHPPRPARGSLDGLEGGPQDLCGTGRGRPRARCV